MSFFVENKQVVSLVRTLGLVGIFLLVLLSGAFAQSKKELERKKAQLHKDIEYTNQLLKETKKNKSSSLNQLVNLNRKINRRTELIQTIQSEIGSVDKNIGTVETNIDSLNLRLARLKDQYARMLYYAYKNQRPASQLLFVFSAENFNQAFKRMQYLRELSRYRHRQHDMIVAIQDSLSGKKRQLQDVRKEKSGLLVAKEQEKKELDKEKKEQVSLLSNLSAKEKKLRADLREKQRKEQQLSARIESIIRKEIEAAQAAARKRSSSGATASKSNNVARTAEKYNSPSVLSNTPEAAKLSSDFENNRGRLPWPVEQGVITSSFGRHPHPVWRDVVVNNNGVDIGSARGARARSVFEGKVLRVIMVVDKYAVLVQHGEYFTLYSNLSEVFVKAGDKLITRQPIGRIQTSDEDGRTEVHLEIWKGSTKMDPEGWLASR